MDVQFLSKDPNLEWVTKTMDSGTTSPTNRIKVITPQTYIGSGKANPFPITYQYNDGSPDKRWIITLPASYTNASGNYVYGKSVSTNLPPLTHATKVFINEGNSKYETFSIDEDMQNTTITNLPYVNNRYEIDGRFSEIDFKASAGYVFKDNGKIKYNLGSFNHFGSATITANGTDTIKFQLPSDWVWSEQNSIKVTLKATKAEIIEQTGGYINMYLTSYRELGKFATSVTTTFGTDGANVYNEVPYISNLHMIPFDIPKDYQTDKTPVIVGSHSVDIQMTGINNTKLKVDLGTITVNRQFNNAYDYNDVKTRLVLPFSNNLDLDIKHTIGKSIHIVYYVDIPTGDTTVTLNQDGYTFLTKQVNISREIPFITAATNQNQYAVVNAFKTLFDNQTLTAYLITEQYEPNLDNDYYETLEKGQLKDYNGNVKARFTNSIDIPADVYTQLNQQLESGVRIK